MPVKIQATVLEIKSAVVVVVLIFLKHNGVSGWAISSCQFCLQSILCKNFYARVTPFAYTIRARLRSSTQFAKAWS